MQISFLTREIIVGLLIFSFIAVVFYTLVVLDEDPKLAKKH